MTANVQQPPGARNPTSLGVEEEWQSACSELIAALEECERLRCGISNDAARLIGIIERDASFGPVSVRHVARLIRRETPYYARLAAEVRAWRAERHARGWI